MVISLLIFPFSPPLAGVVFFCDPFFFLQAYSAADVRLLKNDSQTRQRSDIETQAHDMSFLQSQMILNRGDRESGEG